MRRSAVGILLVAALALLATGCGQPKPKTWVPVTSVRVASSSAQNEIVRSSPFTLYGGDTKVQYSISGFMARIYIYCVPEGQTWKSVTSVAVDKSGESIVTNAGPGTYYLEVHEGFPWTAKYTVTVMEFR